MSVARTAISGGRTRAAKEQVGGAATFELGRVLATPAAVVALTENAELVEADLARHAARDRGDCDDGDRKLNNRAVEDGAASSRSTARQRG